MSDDCKNRPTSGEIHKISTACTKWKKYNTHVYLYTNCVSAFANLSNITIVSIYDTEFVVDNELNNRIKTILNNKSIHIFIRVDLLKNIIVYKMLQTYKYVVFTDIDINTLPRSGPLECEKTGIEEELKTKGLDLDTCFTPEFLFNHDDTKQKLDLSGIVFACKTKNPGFENSFMMFINKQVVIDLIYRVFIKYAIWGITQRKISKYSLDDTSKGIIFEMYKTFYILLSISLGRCTYNDNELNEKTLLTSPNSPISLYFNLHLIIKENTLNNSQIINTNPGKYPIINKKTTMCDDGDILHGYELYIPTKKLILPFTTNTN